MNDGGGFEIRRAASVVLQDDAAVISLLIDLAPKINTAAAAVFGVNLSAEALDAGLGDGEAESGAAALAGACLFRAGEGLEDLLDPAWGNARTMVDYPEFEAAGIRVSLKEGGAKIRVGIALFNNADEVDALLSVTDRWT